MAQHSPLTTVTHAPQVVAEWVNLLGEILDWPDKGRTYMLLRETLHAVRDYLTVDEAADLAAQLPVLIRGIYFEGWVPSRTPVHPRSKDDFLKRISDAFGDEVPLEDPEAAASAVFDLLRQKISWGEFQQVSGAMRKSLRDLWQ